MSKLTTHGTQLGESVLIPCLNIVYRRLRSCRVMSEVVVTCEGSVKENMSIVHFVTLFEISHYCRSAGEIFKNRPLQIVQLANMLKRGMLPL